MSLTECFLETACNRLLMSESIKRMDARVDTLSAENRRLDRSLMKIEILVDLPKDHQPRRSAPKELP